MVKKCGFILLLFISCLAAAQEKKTLFAQAPEDWRGEVIPFPLGFAPEIKWTGVEELRFAPGMFKPEETDFFSYGFVWSLEGKVALDHKILKQDMLAYYKGLYLAVSKLEEKKTDDFHVALRPAKSGFHALAQSSFRGSITWREPFSTEKVQTLNLLIDTWYCTDQKKTVALFILSPHEESHAIWKTLKALNPKACNAL